MLHLLWALLNIALLLFFVVICFRATRLVRTQMGLFASVVFVIGLVSLTGFSGEKASQANQGSKSYFTPQNMILPNTMKHTYVVLEKDLISKIELLVLFGTEKTSNKTVPYDASTSRTGFLPGYQWVPLSTLCLPKGDRFVVYTIGSFQWKLLGLTVYTESKRFAAEVNLK